jgi:hypothetical protein
MATEPTREIMQNIAVLEAYRPDFECLLRDSIEKEKLVDDRCSAM